MDVNDNFPEFAKNYRPVIYENRPPGLTVAKITAEDRDIRSNGPPFEFWLPCGGGCPCPGNPSCADFSFKFVPGMCQLLFDCLFAVDFLTRNTFVIRMLPLVSLVWLLFTLFTRPATVILSFYFDVEHLICLLLLVITILCYYYCWYSQLAFIVGIFVS